MKILLDNGHGENTPGKRSPDNSLFEWSWTRKVAKAIKSELDQMKIDCELLVPENEDISLQERCRRVNEQCEKLGKENVILISIHANANGDGANWDSGTGWEAWTSPGQTESDIVAEYLYKSAIEKLEGFKIRMDKSDGDMDKESKFYILVHTSCPAVLTENLFMTNKTDLEFMLSDEGIDKIVDLHVSGLLDYLIHLHKK